LPEFNAIFPPIPTPFNADHSIDYDGLIGNLELLNQTPVGGVVVGGSNGEFVLLDLDERVLVVQRAREAIPSDKLLIAGSGTESTGSTIELSLRMKDAGADALLIVTPSYYTNLMTVTAFVNHYQRVAEAVQHPILLYNVPANTRLNLQIEAVEELAKHPSIRGLKDSGGDIVRLASIVRRTPDEFQLLAGSASFFLPALSVGAVGCISALANLAPQRLVAIMEAFAAGNTEGAQLLQRNLLEANAAVTAIYGVPGLKAALDMMGYSGGAVREPLQPISDDDRQKLKIILEEADIL
jgi:4-hydroxy-2-oxoglutarate aldolase